MAHAGRRARQDGRRGDGELTPTHFQAADTAPAWKAWTDQTIVDFDRGGVAESCRPDGQWRRSYVSDMPGGGRVVVRVDITEDEASRGSSWRPRWSGSTRCSSRPAPAFVMLDRDGRVVLVNQQVLDDFGKTAAEVIGRTHSELGLKGIDAVLGSWQSASGPQRLKTLEYERNLVHAERHQAHRQGHRRSRSRTKRAACAIS